MLPSRIRPVGRSAIFAQPVEDNNGTMSLAPERPSSTSEPFCHRQMVSQNLMDQNGKFIAALDFREIVSSNDVLGIRMTVCDPPRNLLCPLPVHSAGFSLGRGKTLGTRFPRGIPPKVTSHSRQFSRTNHPANTEGAPKERLPYPIPYTLSPIPFPTAARTAQSTACCPGYAAPAAKTCSQSALSSESPPADPAESAAGR